ncbi:hypothetical protein TEPIDINF_000516 [Tepidibacillus infernus]|uniref:Uncharacterized protein n=1 Tax=Tepidibacillus decaturensis TaxID=1413211 RepID=A0A135L2V4_9BACI|nr:MULTISPECIES: hypothetical protein [Tepidibacillus]KXG43183.1 hypothetical protein U473_03470 [Tepidibacillus decaturensis]GBF10142.1 hypothetical protein HK1_00154 [Tepidibacillus sp. HK-1]
MDQFVKDKMLKKQWTEREIEKEIESEKENLKKTTEYPTYTHPVIQGIIWSEILNPPRAIRPYSPLHRTRS